MSIFSGMLGKSLPKVIGTKDSIELPDGKKTRVVLLNNAATTPPFEATVKTVDEYLLTYGALHRGAGPHANITFQKAEEAMTILRKFLNLSDDQSLVFTQNTSSAINLFVRLLKLTADDVVITTVIEHTSNNLPWRYNSPAKSVYVKAFDDGSLDYADLKQRVEENAGKLKVITITGASNLTGYIPDIKRIADLAHKYGALLFVDAAQLAPHRQIDMQAQGIDALAFSAHKVYAPYGLGVLALSKKILDTEPVEPGGGSIDMISENNIVWAPPTSRHQTGTWNVTGIIAAATSCSILMETGWDAIVSHEKSLVHYAAKQLTSVPGLTLYVPSEKYLKEDRIGTFPFNLEGYHHALLSTVLEKEFGIETRAGAICNHRLVRRWAKVDDQQQKEIEEKIKAGDRLASYGMVRASLAIHNTKKDIDALVTALHILAKTKPKYQYRPLPEDEIYTCINCS